MDKTISEIKDLRPGSFVIIDDAPCKVERIDISKTGKHGHSKARLEAIGILDGRRRSIVGSGSDEVDVPIILKKKAQVLSLANDKAQLMDMESFEVFELDVPDEVKDKIIAGGEAMYFELVGIRTLRQIK